MDSNKPLNKGKQECGPIEAFVRLADQAYIQNLRNHQKGDLETIQKQVAEAQRWLGNGLSAIGALMQGCDHLEGEKLSGAGSLVREFGAVVYQLQDISERLSQTRFNSGKSPTEYVLE